MGLYVRLVERALRDNPDGLTVRGIKSYIIDYPVDKDKSSSYRRKSIPTSVEIGSILCRKIDTEVVDVVAGSKVFALV